MAIMPVARQRTRNSRSKERRNASSKSRRPTTRLSESVNSGQESEPPVEEEQRPRSELSASETKLISYLRDSLGDVSRQRLRAVHMSLRRLATVDSKITQIDLQTALQENQLKLSSRVLQMLLEAFEDHTGVDYEALFRTLVHAQSRTGRDSVEAMHKRNDLNQRSLVSQEEQDADLLRRLEEHLVDAHSCFDTADLQKRCQDRDTDKTGKITHEELVICCTESEISIYGALQKYLIKRCDEERNEKISWPEFLSFLERAQQRAWLTHPELKTLADTREQQRLAKEQEQLEKENAIKLKENEKTNAAEDTLQILPEETFPNSNLTNDRTNVTSSENARAIKQRAMMLVPPIIEIDHVSDSDAEEHATKNTDNLDKQMGMNNEQGQVVGKPIEHMEQKETVSMNDQIMNKQEKNVDVPEKESGDCKMIPEATVQEQNPQPANEGDTSLMEKEGQPGQSAVSGDVSTGSAESAGNSPTIDYPSPSTKKSDKRETAAETTNTLPVESETTNTLPVESETTNTLPVESETTNTLPVESETTNTLPVESMVMKTPPKELRRSDMDWVHTQVKGQTVSVRRTIREADIADCTTDLSQERLKLEWIYGYRGNDCRSNILILSSGEIVYFMATIAVLYDMTKHYQRHYREHTEQIKCITVHSNGNTVATGQFAGKYDTEIKAHIRIWRADTLQTIHVLGDDGAFDQAVLCLAFPKLKSKSSDLDASMDSSVDFQGILVAVNNSSKKLLTVWDIKQGFMLAQSTVDTDAVYEIGFNPKYPEILVTVGKEHICWWRIKAEEMLIQVIAYPEYMTYLKARFITCMTHTSHGDLITGDSNGTIYIWADGKNRITNFITHGHDGSVLTLLMHRGTLLSGGRDNAVKVWQWGKNMDPLGQLEMARSEGGVRMLQSHQDKLLIGTTMNSILTAPLLSQTTTPVEGAVVDDIPITQGHFESAMGMCVVRSTTYPGDFLTAGCDGIICMFSAQRREPVWKLVLKDLVLQTADCNAEANILVFGTAEGYILILNVMEDHTFGELLRQKVSRDPICVIKLSPDEKHVSAGCTDGTICILTLTEKQDGSFKWDYMGKCKTHVGHVVSIDWSIDIHDGSYVIRSSSTGPEQQFWNVSTLEEWDAPSDLYDVAWASNECTLDHRILGVWSSKQALESDIRCVSVNAKKTVVAMGDSSGYISMFRYPCVKPGAFSHTYRAHLSVKNMRFSANDEFIITSGATDASIMQWKVL